MYVTKQFTINGDKPPLMCTLWLGNTDTNVAIRCNYCIISVLRTNVSLAQGMSVGQICAPRSVVRETLPWRRWEFRFSRAEQQATVGAVRNPEGRRWDK